jgi:hypothetical protein
MREAARSDEKKAPEAPARAPAAGKRNPMLARAMALQRAAGNRAAGRVLSRWTAHPDKEQKGVMVADSSAAEYVHFNVPKNE